MFHEAGAVACAFAVRRLLARERQGAGRHEDAVSGDRAFDFAQSTHSAGDVRACLEDGARHRRRRELQRTERGDPQLQRFAREAAVAAVSGVRRSRGQAAGLREQLHENHSRHNRLAGEVPLKIEIVGIRYTSRRGTRAVLNVNDFLDQPHGRLMREAVNQ